jgi:hypothetical protein
MIHLFSAALSPPITALPWVERWGGVAFPVVAPATHIDDQGNEVAIRQTFPVSCDLAATCTDTGHYQRLLPDDAYTSVGWMEALGGYTYALDRPGYAVVTQRVRLIFWLNMQRLGALGCGDLVGFELSALQALPTGRQWSVVRDDFTQPVVVSVQAAQGVPPTPQNVFGPYTFAVQGRLFLHPYAFFGLDLTLKAMVPVGCFCLPEADPVACLDTW